MNLLAYLLKAALLVSVGGSVAAGAPAGRLRVEVTGEGRSLEAYIALAAETEPFSSPLHEEILAADSAAEFTAPPGRYRLVVGAPGFATEYLPAFDLPAGAAESRQVSLKRLAHLCGRVVDAGGAPIAGATVGHWYSFIARSARTLSPLGELRLASNERTTTAADGSFALLALAGARHFVWVEAPGFSPGFLQDILFQLPAASGPWEVRLSAGARLSVGFKRAPAVPAETDHRLVLRLIGPVQPAAALAERHILWERPVSGTAQAWESLPPGDYALWLHAPRRGVHRQAPVRLASVQLTAGTARDLVLELPATLPSGEPIPSAPPLRLMAAETTARELENLAVTVWDDHGPAPQPLAVEQVSGGARVDLPGGCRPARRFLAVAENRVATWALGPAPDCAAPLPLELLPAGTMTGSLRPPAGDKLPRTALVQALECPGRDEPPSRILGAFPFEIQGDGRFEARVPAGCIVASLDVSDFALERLGELQLAPGKPTDLGPRSLVPGGALTARIVAASDGLGLPGVATEALSAAAFDPRGTTAVFGPGGAARRAHSAADGWVRLYGLQEGEYFLGLLPADKSTPQFAGPFTVRARDEAFLGDILLPAPGSLEVVVKASPGLAEEVERFTLLARTVEIETTKRVPQQLAPAVQDERRAFFPELPPGVWSLDFLGFLRDSHATLSSKKTIEVSAGEAHAVTLDISAEVFRGKVTYRGEPVEGRLTLTSLPVHRGRKLSFVLPETGSFKVALDRPGLYQAQVADRKGRFHHATVARVDFSDPGREILIELPAGRITGRVVDPENRPVARAFVEATALQDLGAERESPAGTHQLRMGIPTGEDGSFALEGIPAGDWTLVASAAERKSQRRRVHLPSDGEQQGVELELLAPVMIEGTVTDQQGRPASGVEGIVTFLPNGREPVGGYAQWRSDADGRFKLNAAGHLGSVANFSLTSPEGAVTATRLTVSDPLSIQLPSQWGEVRFRVSGLPSQEAPPPALNLVREDGAVLGPRTVQESPGVHVIRRLAAGRWRVVLADSAAALTALLEGSALSLRSLAAFELRPGDHLSIDLPFPVGGSQP